MVGGFRETRHEREMDHPRTKLALYSLLFILPAVCVGGRSLAIPLKLISQGSLIQSCCYSSSHRDATEAEPLDTIDLPEIRINKVPVYPNNILTTVNVVPFTRAYALPSRNTKRSVLFYDFIGGNLHGIAGWIARRKIKAMCDFECQASPDHDCRRSSAIRKSYCISGISFHEVQTRYSKKWQLNAESRIGGKPGRIGCCLGGGNGLFQANVLSDQHSPLAIRDEATDDRRDAQNDSENRDSLIGPLDPFWIMLGGLFSGLTVFGFGFFFVMKDLSIQEDNGWYRLDGLNWEKICRLIKGWSIVGVGIGIAFIGMLGPMLGWL